MKYNKRVIPLFVILLLLILTSVSIQQLFLSLNRDTAKSSSYTTTVSEPIYTTSLVTIVSIKTVIRPLSLPEEVRINGSVGMVNYVPVSVELSACPENGNSLPFPCQNYDERLTNITGFHGITNYPYPTVETSRSYSITVPNNQSCYFILNYYKNSTGQMLAAPISYPPITSLTGYLYNYYIQCGPVGFNGSGMSCRTTG